MPHNQCRVLRPMRNARRQLIAATGPRMKPFAGRLRSARFQGTVPSTEATLPTTPICWAN